MYQLVLLTLFAVIIRDFHLREIRNAGNDAFRNGYNVGLRQGQRQCSFPVSPILYSSPPKHRVELTPTDSTRTI